MKKLKYCCLIAITAFGLASCGVSKDDLIKECIQKAEKKYPGSDFKPSDYNDGIVTRDDRSRPPLTFAGYPKDVYYVVEVHSDKETTKQIFSTGTTVRCAFYKDGKTYF